MTPRCAVQVDVDSLAVYARYYHLDASAGGALEAFYDAAVPRLLELFARHDVRATFFVVGEEAQGEIGKWLRRMVDAGHEVASHSHRHPFGLTRLSTAELERELAESEDAIAACTGARPVGFRSPGYDIDEAVLDRLEARGYAYDSSVFPTIATPVIRLFQLLVRLGRPGAHGSLGRLALVAAPARAYRPRRDRLWRADATRPLVELPVGTTPLLRLPFYGTFHIVSHPRMFDLGHAMLRRRDFVYALHAVDVLGPDRDAIDARLLVHPGLRVDAAVKIALFDRIFAALARTHTFVTSWALSNAQPSPRGGPHP